MTQLLWHFAKRLVCLMASLLLLMPIAHAQNNKILVFGDSLSAGYGIAKKDSWVALLEKKVAPIKVINASISGETTSGGASRIQAALLRHKPTIVIIELGANDGLQALPVKQMQENLRLIIASALKAKARVLLVGMNVPPNYGAQYQTAFKNVYPALAKEFKVNLVPFLLEGVAGKPTLNQEDGIHPTAKAQPLIFANVWAYLKVML